MELDGKPTTDVLYGRAISPFPPSAEQRMRALVASGVYSRRRRLNCGSLPAAVPCPLHQRERERERETEGDKQRGRQRDIEAA